MTKKLIYILNHYSHAQSSHFYHIIHLLEHLANKGVEIALIIEKADDIPTLEASSIRVYPIQQKKLSRLLKTFLLIRKLNKTGYKKIFIRISWAAALASIVSSVITSQKVYFWNSGQGTIERFNKQSAGIAKVKTWIKSILPFILIRRFSTYLVTGPESMVEYYHKIRKVPLKKIKVLYNDVNLKRFFPLDGKQKSLIRQKLNLPLNKKIILFVHHMSYVRNSSFFIPFILDTFFENKQHQDALFLFIGGGPEKEGLMDSCKAYIQSDQAHFIGEIPNKDMAEWYQSADLFIQPTKAEGFPRTLIEAMACALPIVCTNVGGVRDVLGPEQRTFMVNKNDRLEFSSKLFELYHSVELIEKLSKENKKTILKFSTENVSEMYLATLFPSTE